MSNIKLSICIATYNRAGFIGETLESIISQLTDETEVVIVDGASTDNTREVAATYAQLCPHIHYFCLPQKGGVDQDYCKAVELAQGEFCWLFTDDDLLKKSAIQTVLKLLRNYVLDLVIVNSEVLDVRLSRVLETRRVLIEDDRMFDSSQNNSLLEIAGKYMSFIGCVVIRKSLWESRDKEKYYGSEFVHVGVIFQSTLPQNAYLLAQPQIMIRYGNAQWSSRSFEIWMFKWPRLIWSLDFDAKSKYRVTKYPDPWRRFTPLLAARSLNSYSTDIYKKWVSPNVKFGLKKLGLFGIAILPIPFAIALRTLGRRLAGMERDTLSAYTYDEYIAKHKRVNSKN